jgi:hypothetical protein
MAAMWVSGKGELTIDALMLMPQTKNVPHLVSRVPDTLLPPIGMIYPAKLHPIPPIVIIPIETLLVFPNFTPVALFTYHSAGRYPMSAMPPRVTLIDIHLQLQCITWDFRFQFIFAGSVRQDTCPILLRLLEPTHPVILTRPCISKRHIPPIPRLCEDRTDFVLCILVREAELDDADSEIVLGPWLDGAVGMQHAQPATFGIRVVLGDSIVQKGRVVDISEVVEGGRAAMCEGDEEEQNEEKEFHDSQFVAQ